MHKNFLTPTDLTLLKEMPWRPGRQEIFANAPELNQNQTSLAEKLVKTALARKEFSDTTEHTVYHIQRPHKHYYTARQIWKNAWPNARKRLTHDVELFLKLPVQTATQHNLCGKELMTSITLDMPALTEGHEQQFLQLWKRWAPINVIQQPARAKAKKQYCTMLTSYFHKTAIFKLTKKRRIEAEIVGQQPWLFGVNGLLQLPYNALINKAQKQQFLTIAQKRAIRILDTSQTNPTLLTIDTCDRLSSKHSFILLTHASYSHSLGFDYQQGEADFFRVGFFDKAVSQHTKLMKKIRLYCEAAAPTVKHSPPHFSQATSPNPILDQAIQVIFGVPSRKALITKKLPLMTPCLHMSGHHIFTLTKGARDWPKKALHELIELQNMCNTTPIDGGDDTITHAPSKPCQALPSPLEGNNNCDCGD